MIKIHHRKWKTVAEW